MTHSDAEHVARAVEKANDVDLLINNAGVAQATELTGSSTLEQARHEMEVNVKYLLSCGEAIHLGETISLTSQPALWQRQGHAMDEPKDVDGFVLSQIADFR